MAKYFGTDGIRGVVNETLDVRLAYRAGLAAADVMTRGGARPRVIIGKDTRISGDMLEAALAAGLCSGGADVTELGVLPTPAVAYLATRTGADMGVVISASHNPYEHNGIKMFGGDGFKLSDEFEEEIERLIDLPDVKKKTNGHIGRISRDDGRLTSEYVEHIASLSVSTFPGRIAVDCANGAASATARSLFEAINADFEIMADKPDGVNINEGCGSTHLEPLSEMVRRGGFAAGVAFDGDADRCLVVDEHGELVDGDVIMAVCARAMKSAGTLKGGAVVGTTFSNSGMDGFAEAHGIGFLRADVGDRNVLRVMLETGCNLGGESSGHTIFLDDSTTGDGQLTAVKFLSFAARSGKTVSEFTRDVPRYPQIMMNLKVKDAEKERIISHPSVAGAARSIEEAFSGEGRVLLRLSGTEPVIRVLVEARNAKIAEESAVRLINLMKLL